MRLKKLLLNNVYSFGEGVQCVFDYTGDSTKTLIVGINHDDPGADSNGSGKSNILNSVYWILFGEVFQDENMDAIIRLGQDWCSGTIELVDSRGNALKIGRGRGTGKRKFLTIEYAGENKTLNTDEKTQEEILKYLQISPKLKASEYCNDFINTTYFSSDVAKGFMGKKTTSKDRFLLVERFLGLKRYSYAAELAKKKKQEFMLRIEGLTTQVSTTETYLKEHSETAINKAVQDLQAQLIGIQKDVIALSEKLIKNNDRKTLQILIPQKKSALETKRRGFEQHFEALEKESVNNAKIIDSETAALNTYTGLAADVEKKAVLAKEATTNKTAADTTIQGMQLQLTALTSDTATQTAEINGIRNQIANHLKCPQCRTELMVDGNALKHVNVSELANRLAELEHRRNQNNVLKQDCEKKIGEAKAEAEQHLRTIHAHAAAAVAIKQLRKPEEINANITALTNRNTKIVEDYNKLAAVAEQQLTSLKADIDGLEAQLHTIGDPDFDSAAAELRISQLQSLEAQTNKEMGQFEEQLHTIERSKDAIKMLRERIAAEKTGADIYGFWEIGFRQIKLDIIDKFLPDFEVKVNEYLIRLKVSLRVRFDTQKEKVSASAKDKAEGRAFKEEFYVDVFKEGREPLPYGLMSKGQRGRIGSCVGMALRELTQERGNNVFDFFFMDEVTDALDESGLRELVKLLDELPGQKLVISHTDFLKDYFEDRIVVEIENDVSTIKVA